MSGSITNYKLRITHFQEWMATISTRRLMFLCASLCIFAVSAFGQNLSDEEIRQQATRLNSGNDEVRRDALHQLRASESENASRAAAGGLNDKTEIVRATALFSVLSLPSDEAANDLLPLLKDKSEIVRREAAYALGKTHSLRATQPLLEILQKDKQYSVKCSAAVALGEIGDVSAVAALNEILRRAIKDSEEFLRRSAARSIGQIAETTLQKEFLAQSQVKDFNLFAIENRKTLTAKFPALKSAVGILIQVLQNSKEADDVKRETAFALGALGDAQAVPVLTSKLTAQDYYLAENSRLALQKIAPVINP